MRRDDKGKPLAMETAVVRYVSADRPGVAVDLVGAVHVGDKSYYDELNKLFETYEVRAVRTGGPRRDAHSQGGPERRQCPSRSGPCKTA